VAFCSHEMGLFYNLSFGSGFRDQAVTVIPVTDAGKLVDLEVLDAAQARPGVGEKHPPQVNPYTLDVFVSLTSTTSQPVSLGLSRLGRGCGEA
jgi:hypothetical protein